MTPLKQSGSESTIFKNVTRFSDKLWLREDGRDNSASHPIYAAVF